MLLLAHRGASADAPENTLPAFAEAAAQAADGVELDLQVCASGEVVVCHDEQLERLAGVPWEVEHTRWWKLQRLDVGSRLGFAPARIPLLEEVLDALPRHFEINLELKCEKPDDRGLARKVGLLVQERDLLDRVIVSSFNPLCLERLAIHHPEVKRGYLIDPDKSFFLHGRLLAPLVGTHSIHPAAQDCTEERVEEWHRLGLKVATWTVDDPRTARRLEAMGVDLLITNRPGALRKALS
jgi:glycerophosphoryl diester phosphodiesterase